MGSCRITRFSFPYTQGGILSTCPAALICRFYQFYSYVESINVIKHCLDAGYSGFPGTRWVLSIQILSYYFRLVFLNGMSSFSIFFCFLAILISPSFTFDYILWHLFCCLLSDSKHSPSPLKSPISTSYCVYKPRGSGLLFISKMVFTLIFNSFLRSAPSWPSSHSDSCRSFMYCTVPVMS